MDGGVQPREADSGVSMFHCAVFNSIIDALHHKGHNAHLLHVLLPQRRSWPSGF